MYSSNLTARKRCTDPDVVYRYIGFKVLVLIVASTQCAIILRLVH